LPQLTVNALDRNRERQGQSPGWGEQYEQNQQNERQGSHGGQRVDERKTTGANPTLYRENRLAGKSLDNYGKRVCHMRERKKLKKLRVIVFHRFPLFSLLPKAISRRYAA
jgi:hypothetical protein